MTLPNDETKRNDYIERLREVAKSRVFTEERKQRMSRSMKEKPFSEEHRKNLAEANRKRAERIPSKKVKTNCDYCGKEFDCYPSELVKSVNHYCSHSCSSNARKGKKMKYKNCDKHPNSGVPRTQEVRDKISASQIGKVVSEETRRKISDSRKNEKVVLECPTCHKTFEMSQCEFDRGGKYCSRKCMFESEEWRKLISESKIGRVDSEETRRKKSLSHIGERNYNYGKNISEESRKKMSESKKGLYALDRHPNWKGGVSFEPYCERFNDSLKERVRMFFGNMCAICAKSEHENGKKLSVHHVYAEKKACCEDAIENMDQLRELLPIDIARFGEPEFSEEELVRIRMMVPLCVSCHGRMTNRQFEEEHIKYLDDLIMTKYGGKCYYTEDEYKEILNGR
jgi:hypothetical protein